MDLLGEGHNWLYNIVDIKLCYIWYNKNHTVRQLKNLHKFKKALQDTKTSMVNGAISVVFNIVLNLILVKFMAYSGLALANSIATTIATLLLLNGLKNKIGALGTKAYIITFLKIGLASGVLVVSKLYNLISLVLAVGVWVEDILLAYKG